MSLATEKFMGDFFYFVPQLQRAASRYGHVFDAKRGSRY